MYIDVFLNDNIFTQLIEYSQINDLIGVKGYLDITNNKLIVKAEKVTFLSGERK